MTVKSYRELEIYIEAKQLAVKVHKMSLTLPKFELYEEGGKLDDHPSEEVALRGEGAVECPR